MKKEMMQYAGALLCTLALAASCSNDEATMDNASTTTGKFSLNADMPGTGTRTTVTDDYVVNWTQGDQIYVYGENVNGTLHLTGGAETPTGTFTGVLKGKEAGLQYAVYPEPTGDNKTTLELEDTYNYAQPIASNSPMYATFGADKTKITFKHLCAMIRLTFNGIPAEGEKTLTLTSANGDITGNSTLGEQGAGLVLSAPTGGGKSITVNIPSGTPALGKSLTFDIPLPAGSYASGLTVKMTKAGSEIIAEKTLDGITLKEGEIMVMPELTYVSISGETPSFVEAEHVDAKDIASTDFNDPEKSYVIEGAGVEGEAVELSDTKTITAKSVILSGLNLSSGKPLNINAESVTVSDMKLAGSQPKINGNAMMSINNAKQISFSNITISKTNGYNAIEIGLSTQEDDLPEEVNIDDVKVDRTLANNAIIIFGTQDNAKVNITNCDFGNVSNCVRLSNKSNATGVQVLFKDCKVTA